jgi:hypothetical protein
VKKIIGIEIRSVEMDEGEHKTIYVDRDCILFSYPDANLADDNSFFAHACEYLESYGKGVVSCDTAKINEVYYN